MRVLVVEDEELLAEVIAEGLRREGMAVDVVLDGGAALEHAAVHGYEVIVLDRDLPVVHGDEVCRLLSAGSYPGRILMLTASATVDDRVTGLALGADDYLPKPFAFAELVARVRALGRRAQPPVPPVLEHEGVLLDTARRSAAREGRDLRLTPKEFSVLEILMTASGRVISAEELLERAWDEHANPFTNSVRVTVMTLRRKLGGSSAHRDGSRRRLPAQLMRPTVRVRLTALYGALSLATGVLLTGLSFVLVRNAISDATDAVRQPALVLVRMPGPLGGPAEVVPVDPANVTTGDGRTLDQLESDQRSQVREHAQSQVFVSLSIALLVAAAAAVAVGWIVAGRTLRPLHEMTEKARRLGSSSLHRADRSVRAGRRDQRACRHLRRHA